MAAPMLWRSLFLSIFIVFTTVIIFNKVVVMHYMSAVWRAKILRFQTSCFLESVYSLISLFVWYKLSKCFDNPETESQLTLRKVFSFESDNTVSKLWKYFLISILVSSSFIYPTFSFLISTDPFRISYWIGLCLAYKIQLFTGVVLVKVVLFILRLCRGSRMTHATIFKLHTLVILYAFTSTIMGFFNAIQMPAIVNVQIPIKQLPSHLNGLSITLVTDIHLGPTAGKRNLEKIVNIVNYLQSDLVIIGGDLVDGRVNQLVGSTEPLEWLSPKYGTFFVTGNHEYYTTDVHNWFIDLESRGVHILHNSHVWLPSTTDKGICLAGVDDPQGDSFKFMDHTMDIDKALSPCGDDQPVILISHRPEGAKKALDSKHRVDLVLSGHTHGGQMFPVSIGAYLFNPYYAGLYKHGENSHVYVSMGTRWWGFPVRTGTRSEITKIILQST